jgi:hypothetical protein
MPDLAPVFARCRDLLTPYAARLDVTRDDDSALCLYTRHILPNRKPLFFAAVYAKTSYVSFHLMPVYVEPKLLASISSQLAARMQGKSCFNFRATEPVLVAELDALTKAGFALYVERGLV